MVNRIIREILCLFLMFVISVENVYGMSVTPISKNIIEVSWKEDKNLEISKDSSFLQKKVYNKLSNKRRIKVPNNKLYLRAGKERFYIDYRTAYWGKNSKCYHFNKNCPALRRSHKIYDNVVYWAGSKVACKRCRNE